MTADPDAATTAEKIVTAAAVALHDAHCPDKRCSGSALGESYRQAALVLDAVEPLIAAEARASERQRAREDIITMLHAEAEHQLATGSRIGPKVLREFADLLDGDDDE